MANFSEIRNVIRLDDDNDDEIQVIGSLSVPASSSPPNLDAVASSFGAASAAAQRGFELTLARTPSPGAKILGRNWPGYPAETPGEVNAHGKRAKTSLDSSTIKRARLLSISDTSSPTDPNELVDATRPMESRHFSSTSSLPHRQPTSEEIGNTLVELLDDSDDEVIETSSNTWHDVKKNSKLKAMRRLSENDIVYDLDDYDDSLYEDMVGGIGELAIEEQPVKRKQSVQSSWALCKTALGINGLTVEPGQVLELTDGNFLHVFEVLKNVTSGETTLRGHSLVKACSMNGVLPKKLNEVVWHSEIEFGDERPHHRQGMTEQPLSSVLKLRELRITNRIFPAGSFRETGGFYDKETAKCSAPCTMRWKYTSTFLNAEDRKHNKWHEQSLEHIKNGEVPKGPAYLVIDDARLRFKFRGTTILGGAYGAIQPSGQAPVISIPDGEMPSTQDASSQAFATSSRSMLNNSGSYIESIDLTADNDAEDKRLSANLKLAKDLTGSGSLMSPQLGWCVSSDQMILNAAAQKPIIRGPYQRYTYGDAFCGAGGATGGAAMAGLKVAWGFDANVHACSSWGKNFPASEIHQAWAHDFVELGQGNDKMKVDILHLSPPCQFFSPAHTVAGKDDDLNSASLFACGDLLDKAKPRIATLEQTFGIVALPRFRPYFNALVHMFTCKGFSIRWKVARLQDWGLPQRRQRLIIIASCPGETLPEFPPFTHCDPLKPQPDRSPWVSVNSVLDSIHHNAPDHKLAGVAFNSKDVKTPWSGESIMPRCITTHGGHNYHPSGRRGFTIREFAALQGFPHFHLFSQYNQKKQIGNAVPPSIAKILFESIRMWLERVDGVKADHFQLD